jgi:hypothetical protein
VGHPDNRSRPHSLPAEGPGGRGKHGESSSFPDALRNDPEWRTAVKRIATGFLADRYSGDDIEGWWQRPQTLLGGRSAAALLNEAEAVDDPRVKVVIQLAAGLAGG